MKLGNYIRATNLWGEGWLVQVFLEAKDDEAYEKAKQAIRDLVTNESDSCPSRDQS